MFRVSQTGELLQFSDSEAKCRVEWTIRGLTSKLEKHDYFFSPGFAKRGCLWYLKIYPNSRESSGWMALHLFKEASWYSIGVSFSLGVMKVDGSTEQVAEDIWVFDEYTTTYEIPQFLRRTGLQPWRTLLASGNVLTVTCSLHFTDENCSEITMDNLPENLTNLFVSKSGCDVVLKVRNEEFPAHKSILTTRCSFFAAMFDAEMQEQQTCVVNIQDCHPGAFADFLAYLYSGKLRMDSNDPFELYKIADKYCMKELMCSCIISLMNSLSVENVCQAAISAREIGLGSLKEKIHLFFNKNFRKIIYTAGWKSLLEEHSLLANELLQRMASERNL